MNITDRFFAKVNKSAPSGCWEWQAAIRNGYGRFGYYGKNRLAHRISWLLSGRGDITDCVLHKCDNRKCVNPDHLFLGSREDNIRDMEAKGRARHIGHRVPLKVDEASVRFMKHWLRSGYQQTVIAKTFAVSDAFVYLLKNNKMPTWAGVE